MNLKTFNCELNNSYSRHLKFEKWTSYRQEITDFVNENLAVSKGNLLVLGAGNCHDLNLKDLLQQGHALILTDIDGNSMIDGVERQKVQAEVIEMDYLGLSDRHWIDELQRICLSGHPIEFTKWLSHLMATVKEEHFVWHGKQIDVTLCLPIYTQLLFSQVEGQLRQYWLSDVLREEDYNDYVRALLDIMPSIIGYFNEGLLDLVEKGSQVIVLSDCLEDVPEGSYSQAYEAGKFEQAYDQYCQTYGMGLGHYGLYNLEAQTTPSKSKWFRWPFAHDRVLFVKGIIIKAEQL